MKTIAALVATALLLVLAVPVAAHTGSISSSSDCETGTSISAQLDANVAAGATWVVRINGTSVANGNGPGALVLGPYAAGFGAGNADLTIVYQQETNVYPLTFTRTQSCGEPTPTPTPTPQSNCRNDGTDRPGTCSQPDPSPTPTPVPSPTPAATPTPTPDATPELPLVPTLPPTDTGTADPASEPPPAYLWLIAGLAVLFLVATPSRRRFVNHAHWVGRDQAHKR